MTINPDLNDDAIAQLKEFVSDSMGFYEILERNALGLLAPKFLLADLQEVVRIEEALNTVREYALFIDTMGDREDD